MPQQSRWSGQRQNQKKTDLLINYKTSIKYFIAKCNNHVNDSHESVLCFKVCSVAPSNIRIISPRVVLHTSSLKFSATVHMSGVFLLECIDMT